jgi:hypothetical protein
LPKTALRATALSPQQDALDWNRKALADNEEQSNRLIETITAGQVDGALLELLNEKAKTLKAQRDTLLAEQRQLIENVQPLQEDFDAAPLRETLSRFLELVEEATPEERKQLLSLVVRHIAWFPDGCAIVQYYKMPKPLGLSIEEKQLYETVWFGCPSHHSIKPVILKVTFRLNRLIPEASFFPLSLSQQP